MAKDQGPPLGATDILRRADCDCGDPDGMRVLAASLDLSPGSLVILFISPEADPERLAHEAAQAFAACRVVGCTTAGEITRAGYETGKIVAVGLPVEHFACDAVLVPDLDGLDPHALAREIMGSRAGLLARTPDWPTEFGFTLIDGLSLREDELSAALATTLGPLPLFGGSAGDGIDFGEAFILYDGQVLRNAAVVTLVRTGCAVRVFKLDHLSPTGQKMVVTAADPARRVVSEINAAPAAREYARILGIDPEGLGAMTFAAHPLLVQLGDQHHVRAIQRIDEDGNLVFFSAIDVGVVLTLAEADHIARHLDSELSDLAAGAPPVGILAFDCILRRIEAEERQLSGEISHILRKHGVIGFNTYGEQINSMHVNQTLTGVAVYPPGRSRLNESPPAQSR